MQIEPKKPSLIPPSSEPGGKSANTSEVTYRELHPSDASCPITQEDLSSVAKFRRKTQDNGWAQVRVHSPWSRGARPESRGKQPVGRDWQVQKNDPELQNPRSWSANTGIRTAGLRLFDIDVDDPSTVDEIVAAIAQTARIDLEDLMIRRRSNSPRVSILFRASEGTPKKRVLSGRDKKGCPGKVEVLGDGQQFVAHGWHASCLDGSARITWQSSPADTPRDQVAAISEEQVDAILGEIATLLDEPKRPIPGSGRAGSRISLEQAFEQPGKLAAVFASQPVPRGELAHDDQLGQADIRSCLDALPNDRVDWDWWNTIGMRVFAASNGEAYGLEEWKRWSATAPLHPGKDTCDARWEHFHHSPPTRTGAGALIAAVRRAANEPDWMPDGASYYARGEFPLSVPGNGSSPCSEHVTPRGNWNPFSSKFGSLVNPYVCEAIDPHKPIPPRAWAYGFKLLRGEITVLAGKGGYGKSASVIGVSCAAASGRDLLGDKVWGGPLRVVYKNSEDDTDELRRRIVAASRYHKLTDADLANIRICGVNTPGHQTLTTGDDKAPRINEAGFSALDNILALERPDILVLDPLGPFCPAGINDNGLMGQVMLRLKQLAKKYECAICLVHHTRKDSDLTSTDAIGGASAIVNQARVALLIARMTQDEAKHFRGVRVTELWRYLRILDAKTNLAPPSADTQWYQLITHELLNGDNALYPTGDRVQVVAKLDPQQLNASPAGAALDNAAKRAILAVAHGANPPLSPSAKGGSDRYITPKVLHVVRQATSLHWVDRDLTKHVDSLVKEMIAVGWLRIDDVKVGRNTRKGLVVNWARTPWAHEFSDLDQGPNRHEVPDQYQMRQMHQIRIDASDARAQGGIDARRPGGASNVPKGCGDLKQHDFDALPDAGPIGPAEPVGTMSPQNRVDLPDMTIVLDLLPEYEGR
jgi:hypothetical protein